MKIGIMTLWWSEDNYGQLLQCYALQKYLRDMGHDAYLIRYDRRRDFKLSIGRKILKASNPVKLYKFLKRKVIDRKERRDNPRNFEEFRNKHIKQSEKKYHSYRELVKNPPVADMYVVGSDQVWNTCGVPINMAINVINAYLLNFGDASTRRISYAASFGKRKEELDSKFISGFEPLLKKMDYVSVRENSGLEICKLCGIDNAKLVPDPTMLLAPDMYRVLYMDKEAIKKPARPYCFLYLLGNEFNFSVHAVYSWAQSRGAEVIYVAGNMQQDRYKKTYATIYEWIYLLEHADYVITNSYHCALFSLLFEKKFGIIPLYGKSEGMNSRFDTMFQLFGIENRFADIDLSVLDNNIDWQSVCSTFQNLRNACKLDGIFR